MLRTHRFRTYYIFVLLSLPFFVIFIMTRDRRSVTYVYESLISSRDSNYDYNTEDSTFPNYILDDTSGSIPWQPDKDTENDRVKEVTNRPGQEKVYDFPTKVTTDKANENAPDDVTSNHLKTGKITAYTKQPTQESDQDYTSKRKLEQETNEFFTKKIGSDNVVVGATEAYLEKEDRDTEDMKNKMTQKHIQSISTAQLKLGVISNESSKHDVETNLEAESTQRDRPMKTLLWYDTHEKSMRGHTTSQGFSKCEYNNCEYKSYLSRTDTKPSKPFDADAILIQSAGIWDLSPPPRRDENQVFVLAVRDSFPRTTAERDPGMGMKWLDVFNWTMTYRLDSDIVYKYGNIVERENKTELVGKNYDQIFDEKVDNAVWLVSHCRTSSMREHYVREMQSVMGVDIFGRCGVPPPCPKGSADIEKCIDDTAMKYKYYLSFENTLVEDYVTEKVYRWYSKDIVVVVRGGSNYSRILPPGTFVDAGEFASPVELGKYLKELARDKKRYTDILKKKDNYYSTDRLVPAQEANCKLCEYLNHIDDHRNSYDNIIKWWLKNWRNFGIGPTPLKDWPR